MNQRSILVEAIGMPLKSAGFKRRKDTWYLDGDGTIEILNLQKSNYGLQYYINIGVWLKALGDAEFPKEYQCHIRFRWNELIPQDEKSLGRLLDLEDRALTDQDRKATIDKFLGSYILPFFSAASSVTGLRTLYGSDAWPNCLVNRMAQELLR